MRHYLPGLGRFISRVHLHQAVAMGRTTYRELRDVWGINIGPPGTMEAFARGRAPEHPYSYAKGNPTNLIDPSGRTPFRSIVYQCDEHPQCNPAQERDVIEQRIHQLEEALRQRRVPPAGGESDVAVATSCECRNGQTVSVTRCGFWYWHDTTPCFRLCLNEHEQTHRYQCKVRGAAEFARLFGRPEEWWKRWNLETDAYEREVKCLRRLLSSAG